VGEEGRLGGIAVDLADANRLRLGMGDGGRSEAECMDGGATGYGHSGTPLNSGISNAIRGFTATAHQAIGASIAQHSTIQALTGAGAAMAGYSKGKGVGCQYFCSL
jgi:hypothetical protein